MRVSRHARVLVCAVISSVSFACAASSGSPESAPGGAGGAAASGALGSDSGGMRAATGGRATTGTGGKAGTGGVASSTGGRSGSGGTPTGGTGGGSASGGSAGGPPHVVGDCKGLPPVGQFEEITPPQLHITSQSLGMLAAVVDPSNSAVVYTSGAVNANGGGGIYKSTDCGATWNKADTGRNSSAVDSGDQWQMIIDPVTPNVMYAINGYGSPPSLFKSTNSGVDWDNLFPPGSDIVKLVPDFTQAVSMDPTDHLHLVVTFHANCTGQYAPMCMGETKDGGATWHVFKGPTDGWVEGGNPIVLNGTTFLYAAPFSWGALYYTSDNGATWSKVGPGTNGQIYHRQDGSWLLGGDTMVSSLDGHSWKSNPGTPGGTALIGTGTSVITTYQNDFSGQPFYKVSEKDLSGSTRVASPNIPHGASFMSYDRDHHILYAPCWNAGLWRVVIQ